MGLQESRASREAWELLGWMGCLVCLALWDLRESGDLMDDLELRVTLASLG
jgi:hypothetical protein